MLNNKVNKVLSISFFINSGCNTSKNGEYYFPELLTKTISELYSTKSPSL